MSYNAYDAYDAYDAYVSPPPSAARRSTTSSSSFEGIEGIEGYFGYNSDEDDGMLRKKARTHPLRFRTDNNLVDDDDVDGLDDLDDPDETADLGDDVNARSATAVRIGPSTTLALLATTITNRMEAQVAHPDAQHAPINSSIVGDGVAKKAFLTLLPVDIQRTVFLKIAGSQKSWPRLRALFGAPPYPFLRPSDADVIRAAGIAHGRTNMSYDDKPDQRHTSLNYTQFGLPHMIDQHGRQYRIAQEGANADQTHVALYSFTGDGRERSKLVLLHVRIKRRGRVEKMKLMKTREGAQAITFPSLGEKLRMDESLEMRRFRGAAAGGEEARTSSNMEFQVERIIHRGASNQGTFGGSLVATGMIAARLLSGIV